MGGKNEPSLKCGDGFGGGVGGRPGGLEVEAAGIGRRPDILVVFRMLPLPFGAGLFFCVGPAPQISSICILVQQVSVLFPDLRHLSSLAPVAYRAGGDIHFYRRMQKVNFANTEF